MVQRFLRIQPKLEIVAATNGVHMDLSTTPLFTIQCSTLGTQLSEINTVTTALQSHSDTLEDCWYFVDTLSISVLD